MTPKPIPSFRPFASLLFSLLLLVILGANADSAPFSFAVFGDNRDGDAVFKKIIQTIHQDADIAFAVSLGDIVPSGRENQYQRYLKMTQKARFKIYHCIGNHELPNGGYRRFEKYFGRPFGSWDYQNAHFIKLDNVSQMGLGKKQENWLYQDLAANQQKITFVFLHKPMFDTTGHMPHYVMGPQQLVQKLHLTFQQEKVRAVFAGHIHGYGQGTRDGIEYMVSGGAGSPLYLPRFSGGFYHYLKVTVRGAKVTYQVVKIEPPYK